MTATRRDFRLMWAGLSVSCIGDTLAIVAMPLLIFRATGSVQDMTFLTALVAAGKLGSAALSGHVVDRFDRVRVLLLCEALGALWTAVLPLTWLLYGPSPLLVYICGFVWGVLWTMADVAIWALIPEVATKSRVAEANAKLQASAGVAAILGPSLAGHMSERWGPTAVVAIDSFTFTVSCVCLALIGRRVRRPADVADTMKFTGLRSEGLRWILQTPTLRTLAAILFVESLLTGAVLDLFLYFLKDGLKQSDSAVGTVYTCAGVGGVAASVLAPRILKWSNVHTAYLVTGAVMALVLMGLPHARALYALSILGGLYYFSTTLRRALLIVRCQQISPPNALGRVVGIFMLILALPLPFGAFAAGVAAHRVGVKTTLVALGFALAGLFMVTIPARSLRAHSPSSA